MTFSHALNNTVQNLQKIARDSLGRFPVPCLFSLALCVYLLVASRQKIPHSDFFRNVITLLYGYLGIAFFQIQEWKNDGASHPLRRRCAQGIIVLLVLSEIGGIWLHSYTLLTYIMITTGLGGLIAIAPYIGKTALASHVWAYQHRLLSVAVFTSGSLFLVWAGIMFITVILSSLFGIHMYHNFFADLPIVLFQGIFPVLFLGQVPAQHDLAPQPSSGRIIMGLSLYALIPLLLVTLGIYNAYAVKILARWSLPKGAISYFVGSAGFWVMALYLFTDSEHLQTHPLVTFFRRWVFVLFAVPLVIMGIGIYQRIDTYGLTDTRYILVLYWLWLMMLSVLSFTKYRQRFSTISYLLLAYFCLVCTQGWWAVERLPVEMQARRLEQLLHQHDLLKDNAFQPAKSKVPQTDVQRIFSSFYYLQRNKEYACTLRPWLKDLRESKDFTSDARKKMNITAVSPENARRRYTHPAYDKKQFFKIRGYDYISDQLFLFVNGQGKCSPVKQSIPDANKAVVISYDQKTSVFEIKDDTSGHLFFRISRSDLFHTLETVKDPAALAKAMLFKGKGEGMEVVFQILSIEWGDSHYNFLNIHGYLMVKTLK